MTEAVDEEKVTVSKVCQDFRVREDGALASKLQEEEFQKHYIRNKSERKTVRGDVRVAKQTYLEEVKTAQLLPEHELEGLSMEETDKWLARDLQDKLHYEERKEIERQRKLSVKDAKVAKTLQEREKEKFDREWHRRREEETLGREQQEREQIRIEREELDEQTARELRDERMARELQECERQEYERERERYRYERSRERLRHERQLRERERMDGDEMDRQKELEMRDARIARDLQEREKQKFDREWQRRREQEMREEQERRHYQRSASDPNDSKKTSSRLPVEGVGINGHSHSVIHRQHRAGSGRGDRRENRTSSGSNSSGGSVGREERRSKEERRPPREERSPRTERKSLHREERRPPREERTQPRDERRPPRGERATPRDEGSHPREEQTRPRGERVTPRDERSHPREEQTTPREERRQPKKERSPPREIRRRDHEESAVVALPPVENGGGRLEHDRIIMADGTAIQLFDDEEEQQKAQKAIAEEKQKALEREKRKALEREKQLALEKEKQRALELEKVKKDEEYARMLQDQERRIVEAERTAAEDRRLAMEEQDRELARHLQRQEYHRMQQEKKERQMRRANSIPSDRHSVNIEDPRRLPSYEEALHRRQLPDLLPGSDTTNARYSYVVSTTSSGGRASSLERQTNIEVEREKYAAQEQDRAVRQHIISRGPQGENHLIAEGGVTSREPEGFLREERAVRHSLDREERYKLIEREYSDDEIELRESSKDNVYTRDAVDNRPVPVEDRQTTSEDGQPPESLHNKRTFPIITDFENLEQEDSDGEGQTNLEQAIWQTRAPVTNSPQTSLERNKDNPEHNKLSARSSYASSGGNSFDRRSQHSESPPKHEDVWERFEDDEFSNATGRMSRQMFRSQTVASAEPTNHESERHFIYNVVEGIDPTFRRQRKNSEDDPKEISAEEKAKAIQLIKPQRRRSSDKKKSKDKKK